MNKSRYPFHKSWRWRFVALTDLFLDYFSPNLKKIQFPSNVKRILVIRLDQIGDIVCSLPAFECLRNRFQGALITALVSEEGAEVLKHSPYVDEILVFRSNWFSRKRLLDTEELFSILTLLHNHKFDLGFDLRGDLRNILLMVLSKVRYRVGYGIAGGKALLHESPEFDCELHQVELNQNLVAMERIPKSKLRPRICLTQEEQVMARTSLSQIDSEKRILIAIHPEAGYSSKEWGMNHFIRLVERLIQEEQVTVLVFGLNHARETADFFKDSKQVLNFVGRVSLRGMMALLNECHLFIGNDSGPSHLAHALGVPCVITASGTNNYEKWGVWLAPNRVFKQLVPCSPCYLSHCSVEGHPCMSHITVESVAQAAFQLAIGGT